MGVTTGKIKAGVFAFASVDPGTHDVYNWWHSSDHIPENLGVPGVQLGTRYVATPDLAAMRPPCYPELEPVQYVVMYFMGRPDVDRTIHEFHQTGNRLRASGRDFTHRGIHFASPFYYDGAYVAPRLPIAPGALPFRPHKGIHLTMLDLKDSSQHEAVKRYYDEVHFPDMCSLRGFAGAMRFVSWGARPYAGFVNPPERFIHIYFLDDEPLEALADLRVQLPQWVEAGRGLPECPRRVVCAGSFRSIPAGDYGWLDKLDWL